MSPSEGPLDIIPEEGSSARQTPINEDFDRSSEKDGAVGALRTVAEDGVGVLDGSDGVEEVGGVLGDLMASLRQVGHFEDIKEKKKVGESDDPRGARESSIDEARKEGGGRDALSQAITAGEDAKDKILTTLRPLLQEILENKGLSWEDVVSAVDSLTLGDLKHGAVNPDYLVQKITLLPVSIAKDQGPPAPSLSPFDHTPRQPLSADEPFKFKAPFVFEGDKSQETPALPLEAAATKCGTCGHNVPHGETFCGQCGYLHKVWSPASHPSESLGGDASALTANDDGHEMKNPAEPEPVSLLRICLLLIYDPSIHSSICECVHELMKGGKDFTQNQANHIDLGRSRKRR